MNTAEQIFVDQLRAVILAWVNGNTVSQDFSDQFLGYIFRLMSLLGKDQEKNVALSSTDVKAIYEYCREHEQLVWHNAIDLNYAICGLLDAFEFANRREERRASHNIFSHESDSSQEDGLVVSWTGTPLKASVGPDGFVEPTTLATSSTESDMPAIPTTLVTSSVEPKPTLDPIPRSADDDDDSECELVLKCPFFVKKEVVDKDDDSEDDADNADDVKKETDKADDVNMDSDNAVDDNKDSDSNEDSDSEDDVSEDSDSDSDSEDDVSEDSDSDKDSDDSDDVSKDSDSDDDDDDDDSESDLEIHRRHHHRRHRHHYHFFTFTPLNKKQRKF